MPILATLRKTRWQRQRERHQTKGLMRKTMAVHVRYKSLYISQFVAHCKTRTWTDQVLRSLRKANDKGQFFVFLLKMNAIVTYLA